MAKRARRARTVRVAGRPGPPGRGGLVRLTHAPAPPGGADRGLLSVQLLPVFLAAGDLPQVAVGEELDVAPAVYASRRHPATGDAEWWTVDEFGALDASGSVLSPPSDGIACGCHVELLDADGSLFPLNWAETEPTGGRIRLDGALYLDPELAAGTEHGEAIALCRRPYRVTAVRRYVRTAGPPVLPVPLPAIPGPAEASDAAVYVADLAPVVDAEGPPG